MKLFFFDLETSGLDHRIHGIHQISGKIEVNGVTRETFNFKAQLHNGASIEEAALKIAGVTLNDIQSYEPISKVFADLKTVINRYVSPYDKTDRFHLVGYNNSSFDNQFLREWFLRNGDKYFGSYFWSDSIDVLCLASNHLRAERRTMENFKLATVAAKMGIKIDADKLHDAMYDIELTEAIYKMIINREQVVKGLEETLAKN